jgi:hypothetical protein
MMRQILFTILTSVGAHRAMHPFSQGEQTSGHSSCKTPFSEVVIVASRGSMSALALKSSIESWRHATPIDTL